MAKKSSNNMTYAMIAVVIVAVAGIGAYMYYGGSLSYGTQGPSAYTQTAQNSGVPPTITVNTATGALGTYLVGTNGMTLYYFTKDTSGAAPVSACSGTCLAKWSAFHSASWTLPSSLKAADFSSFTRADGAMQSTYKGWPLYYYSGDAKAGDTNGQGVGGFWYVVAA